MTDEPVPQAELRPSPASAFKAGAYKTISWTTPAGDQHVFTIRRINHMTLLRRGVAPDFPPEALGPEHRTDRVMKIVQGMHNRPGETGPKWYPFFRAVLEEGVVEPRLTAKSPADCGEDEVSFELLAHDEINFLINEISALSNWTVSPEATRLADAAPPPLHSVQ